jgi:pyruvate,orthophosphate dikinase
MQCRAIFEAACKAKERKVSSWRSWCRWSLWSEECDSSRAIHEVAQQVMADHGMTIEYKVGTIELPRAALMADKIKYVDFFSFGTNDLTQTTLATAMIQPASFHYVDRKIIPGSLQARSRRCGPTCADGYGTRRSVKPDLKVGIVANTAATRGPSLLQRDGLNYVSCSPFRVPVAAGGGACGAGGRSRSVRVAGC